MSLLGIRRKVERLAREVRKAGIQRIHPSAAPHPVFVVGAHRCGTSMTLQAFDRGDYSIAYEQSDERAFCDNMLRDDRTIQVLIDRCHGDVAAFKPLRQNQQIGRYLTVFPSLRVVWLVRDYRAAAASAAAMWSSIHQSFQNHLSGVGESDWRFEGMSDNQREILETYYAPELSPISVYALFWYLRSSFYFEHRLDREERVCLFFYEDLVQCPEESFRRMMDFCDCRFDNKVHRHVKPQRAHVLSDEVDAPIAELCKGLLERLTLQDRKRRGAAATPQVRKAHLGETHSNTQFESSRT